MHHITNIGLINPHTKGNSRHHQRNFTDHKAFLNTSTVFVFHTGVICAGINARLLQISGNLLGRVLQGDIHNTVSTLVARKQSF